MEVVEAAAVLHLVVVAALTPTSLSLSSLGDVDVVCCDRPPR